MKTTVGNIYKAFKALDSAKVSTLETAERQQVVKLWFALSDAGKKHSDLIEKTVKELRPEGFDALAILRGEGSEVTGNAPFLGVPDDGVNDFSQIAFAHRERINTFAVKLA